MENTKKNVKKSALGEIAKADGAFYINFANKKADWHYTNPL